MSSVLRIARIWPFAALLLAGCAEHLERPAALPATCASPAGAGGLGLGCANRANLAAMVADPEDLLHGVRAAGLSNVTTSDKAVGAYGARAPSGAAGTVKAESSKGG